MKSNNSSQSNSKSEDTLSGTYVYTDGNVQSKKTEHVLNTSEPSQDTLHKLIKDAADNLTDKLRGLLNKDGVWSSEYNGVLLEIEELATSEPPQDTSLDDLMLNYSAEMYEYRNIMNPTTKWADLTAHQRSVVNTYRSEILAWHKAEIAKLFEQIRSEVIGRQTATYHDHPFLSDYAMANIRIAVNDMMLYDKSQHFTEKTKEWFENKINEIVSGELNHKCKNTLRTEQREALTRLEQDNA